MIGSVKRNFRVKISSSCSDQQQWQGAQAHPQSAGARHANSIIETKQAQVAWPQKQQLRRLGALLERCVASEAPVVAPRSVAGTLLER